MKIPCVCDAGFHSFTAKEMVDIIGSFQRGELHERVPRSGYIIPVCLGKYRRSGSVGEKCGVILKNGGRCMHPVGHKEGRHG